MIKTKKDQLSKYVSSLKKIVCRIDDFQLKIDEKNQVYINLWCVTRYNTLWSIPGILIYHLLILLKEKEWANLKNKYCYLLYDENDYFRGLAQLEPDGYKHLFFTVDKSVFSWYEIEYPSFLDFKLITKIK